MTRRVAMLVALAALAAAPAFAQEVGSEEVILMKDGSYIRGTVVAATDAEITLKLPDEGTTTLSFTTLHPTYVYRVRSKRLAKDDAKGHLALGDYCLENGLYWHALKEYGEAEAVDPTLGAALAERRAKVASEESRALLARGITQVQEEKYEEAMITFRLLREKYPDAAEAEQARGELAKVAAILQEKNEERKKRLEELKAGRARKKEVKEEEAERAAMDGALRSIETARQHYKTGLEFEGKTDVGRAIKAWEDGDLQLEQARALLEELVKAAKEPEAMEQAREKLDEVKQVQILIALSLGQLYTRELNFTQGLAWTNRVLALEPDNSTATRLKLSITEEIMRTRLLHGRGY